MGYLRAAIGTTLLFVVALLGFIFFAFNADYKLDKAEEEYLKGDHRAASEILSQLENKIEEHKLFLCKAYIARTEGNLPLSDQYLTNAINLSNRQNKKNFDLLLEIHLNQLLNETLKENRQNLHTLLPFAAALDAHQAHVRLFTALEKSYNEDYKGALEILNTPCEIHYLSGWMKKSFEENLSPAWQALLTARCEIETGQYLTGRKILECHFSAFSGSQIVMANFLNGWSYIKESEERPFAAATPYFKLGLSYLDKVPLQEPYFQKQTQEIVVKMKSAAEALFEEENYSDMAIFSQSLCQWKCTQEVEQLQKKFLERCATTLTAGNLQKLEKLIQSAPCVFPNSNIQQTILATIEDALFEYLATREDKTLIDFWNLARSCSPDPAAFTKHLAEKTHGIILSMIEEDNSDLDLTSPYIDFWQVIQHDHQERYKFAQELTALSGSIWLKDNGEKKAFKLMKIASTLPFLSEKKMLQEALEKSLQIVYRSAIAQDKINRLSAVMEAFRYFQIESNQLLNKKEIANQLADAKYLYQQKRYSDTLKKISLILSVDPQNDEALKLSGLAKYKLGEHAEALAILKPISNPSSEVQEAVAVCQILCEQKAAGLKTLEDLYKTSQTTRQTCIDTGFYLLMQDDGENAKKWLCRISDPSGTIYSGLCFASALCKDWSNVLDYYGRLSHPYNALTGLQISAAQALALQHQIELAEQMFQKAINNQSQPSSDLFVSYFKNFKEMKLDKINPMVAYGDFYANSKHDFAQALKCYDQIQESSDELSYKKGIAYKGLGNSATAEQLLKCIVNGRSSYKNDAAFALAEIYADLGLYTTAIEHYKAYYQACPKEVQGRGRYAQALSQMHQWSDSLNQLKEMKQSTGSLSPEYRFLFIQNIFYLGSTSQAIKEIEQWMAEKNEIPLRFRVLMAKFCMDTGCEIALDAITQTFEDPASLPISDQVTLFDYYTLRGSDATCREILSACEESMGQSEEGLVLLERWAERQSDQNLMKQAITDLAAREVVSSAAVECLKKHPSLAAFHRERAAALANKHKKYPEDISTLIDSIDAALYIAEEPSLSDGRDIASQALKALSAVPEKFQNLPQVHSLKARCCKLNKEEETACKEWEAACKLDPSDWRSALALAQFYEKQGLTEKTISYLEKCVRFCPDSIEHWISLSSLHMQEEDLISAKNCLQSAANRRPNDVQLQKDLGKLLLKLHRPEGARLALKRAATLNPKDEETLSLLMTCLYHDGMDKRGNEDIELRADREQTYINLKAVNSDLADRLLSEMNSSR